MIVHDRRAAFAVHPAGVTVEVVLLLPDRDAMFDLIDDEAASQKGFLPVPRAHPHPHGHLAQLQITDAVYASGVFHAKALHGRGDDALAFLIRQQLEGLVLQMPHLLAFVVVAYPAFKRGVATTGRINDLLAFDFGVDGCLGEAEGFHGGSLCRQPPATGGMNTTASPSASGWDQSLNSALMATRKLSAPRENGWRRCSSVYRSRGVRAAVATVSSLRPACSRRMA